MSTWRLKGYVQDSDEEEEDIESIRADPSEPSQNASDDQRVVATGGEHEQTTLSPGLPAKGGEERLGHNGDTSSEAENTLRDRVSADITYDSIPPAIAPFAKRRSLTESPDPLQRSPTPIQPVSKPLVSSQVLGTSINPNVDSRSDVLNLEFLSDSTDSDALSDPPSDDEPAVTFDSPKRQVEVRVVIPQSRTASNDVGIQRGARSFRPRKPIQLHPYLIDGEKHRREWQGVGLRPVARPQSPVRRSVQTDTETQEREFELEDGSPANSPPEAGRLSTNRRRLTSLELLADSVASASSKRMTHRRRHPPTQPETHALSHKRRRLNGPSPAKPSQQNPANTGAGKIERSDNTSALHGPGLWDVPQSPPYSSSPPMNTSASVSRRSVRMTASAPLRDLLTPSTSSSVRGDPRLDLRPIPDSDSDADPVTTNSATRMRAISVHSDKSAQGSSTNGSDSEPAENEVQHIKKRIKGVLPASWLRIDQQAQERRNAQMRARMVSSPPPEEVERQRGVAHAVVRRRKGHNNVSTQGHHAREAVVISDESDDGVEVLPQNHPNDGLQAAYIASELAAAFDSRYADDDSEGMENDRLPLFSLGGASRKPSGAKRKRQLKLTDTSAKSKKPRFADEGPRGARVSGAPRKSGFKRQNVHKKTRYIPPALSIVDIDPSPSRDTALPQFIRVAMRRARERPDQGRQSPRSKHIRLQTSHDTKEANEYLSHWKKGALQPRSTTTRPKSYQSRRQPLAARIDNQQQCEDEPRTRAPITGGFDTHASAYTPTHQTEVQDAGDDPLTRKLPQAAMPSPRTLSDTNTRKSSAKSIHCKAPTLRTAQLEGPESQFGQTHRKIVFERGLRKADQQFALHRWEPIVNPQLARFLADDDAILPPLPFVKDDGEIGIRPKDLTPPSKSRIVRKLRAQRIDVETREYRQPSEPAVQELFEDITVEANEVEEGRILQGLGPFGTRYPTTFDVSPLPLGTYFGSNTFIGNDELHRALLTGERDMDIFAGSCKLQHGEQAIECGTWDDETYAKIAALMESVFVLLDSTSTQSEDGHSSNTISTIFSDISSVLRSFIRFLSTNISFLDVVDRQDFASRMKQLLESLHARLLQAWDKVSTELQPSQGSWSRTRTMTYLAVAALQVRQVSDHPVVDRSIGPELGSLICNIAKTIVRALFSRGISSLSDFLEQIKKYTIREGGIQEEDILVESVVSWRHILEKASIPGVKFWDLVSLELTQQMKGATQVKTFESIWASAFTLLPFSEVDDSGVLVVNGRASSQDDSWGFVRDILKRLLDLYPEIGKPRSSSLNDYVRATFTRCHVLIHFWHWKRCDVIFSVLFDFFAKNGLRQLPREHTKGSPRFLDDLSEPVSLDVEPDDSAFHIYLKCLVLGLRSMKDAYTEKKIRSIVFRCTPNHGRSHPKDQSLDSESLVALRNHHDLLASLYWASPPSCRPKLELIRGLVQHESSHREACRLNVRAWANLTSFQLSTDEPYASLQPFAHWHLDIMQQTLKQYRQAKTEAEQFFKAAEYDGTSDVSALMVRTTMNKNQEQVIATLRDCISGMLKAVKRNAGHASMRTFLTDSGIVGLLELAHLDDARLTIVIRETLAVLKEYATLTRQTASAQVSQQNNDESQDYGDFPTLDDLESVEHSTSGQHSLDFIQRPLWHLLSNAFGAERSPDDNLLMDCIDTWVLIAGCQVSSGERSWSYYVDSYSQVAWQQLRDTDQTRKFTPYFMAALIECDPSAYKEHRHTFQSALLTSLVERESMLRFQHRLLHAVVRTDTLCPMFKNLPFHSNERTNEVDITADTLRSRRLALISSIMSNMREDLHGTYLASPEEAAEIRRDYAAMLKGFMNAMKYNYQQLRQGTNPTGAYVEFVQKIVQFLKQYASDICVVDQFFTDSVAFPLPATDPTYVLGRLCGYAPKLASPGVPKQLSTFVQTVAQQATLDNQQLYLISQLSTALGDPHSHSAEKRALRSVLLQGIVPAYIEVAFSSPMGLVVAKPILQSLRFIMKAMLFDLRVNNTLNVQIICQDIWAVCEAFVRSSEVVVSDTSLLHRPYILHALWLGISAISAIVPTLEYISNRTSDSRKMPQIITYVSDLTVFIALVMHGRHGHEMPAFDFSAEATRSKHADLLSFSTNALRDCISKNWSEVQGSIFHGHGQGKREVVVDMGNAEEETCRVVSAIETWHGTVEWIFGNGGAVNNEVDLEPLGDIPV